MKKTFKEKKDFYKERQIIYDKVKEAKEKDLNEIELFNKKYQIVSKEQADHVLIYSKNMKRPIIAYYHGRREAVFFKKFNLFLSSEKAKSSVLLYLKLDEE